MKSPMVLWCALSAGCLLLAGCPEPQQVPPRSLAEYGRMAQSNPQGYPKQVIVRHNLQRALDPDLPAAQRVQSFELTVRLVGDDPVVQKELFVILGEPQCPRDLHQAALTHLVATDDPRLAPYILQALPGLTGQSALRDAIFNWLLRHPDPTVLAEVVKIWAQESSVTGPNEPRFRHLVEQLGGRPWDETLLAGINMPTFMARGSALEVLVRRLPAEALRARIGAVEPLSEAMAALKLFQERFDYLPSSGQEFVAVAAIHKVRYDLIDEAARLFRAWREAYGYRFNIRDFHLLSGIAGDPLRVNLRRTQLALELGKALSGRPQAPRAQSGGAGAGNFWLVAETLSISDMWNLYFLNEMLTRPRVQLALRVMAAGDRADLKRAWGGLVFYENGQAEAKLYPAGHDAGENDLTYVPSRQAALDGRDALCRFFGHFEKIENSRRAGPDAAELPDARAGNYCGLVLTSLSEDSFSAHYYNPDGVVVSMGVFPFRR